MLELCTPVLFGSAKVAQETAAKIEVEPVAFNVVRNAAEALEGRVNLVPVCKDAEPEVQFGQQTEAALRAEAQSLTAALEAFSRHEIDTLVALPGHLDNDADSHALTEFIQKALGGQQEAFDWVINGDIRALFLHHQSASTELGEGLASEAFQARINAISQNMRQDFGLMRPRIALVSQPDKFQGDIAELKEQGVMVFGPLDANTFVEGQWQHHYDGCLFMEEKDSLYTVLDAEDKDYTIGYVSGLPLILTYPLTGINYNQAGKGQTSESPLRQAIYSAIDIWRNRSSYRFAIHHPLEKQWNPRGRDDYKLDLTKEE